ncbi:MAG: glycosyltransferase family 2 protein, partial [Desulfobacterales bacterium]|nr:glycosyltransferase family 2 protein [Desulfobacterales bacterium]
RREYKKPVEVDSCIGACLMVRKKTMDEVGLLDKRYFFFFEETDWAYRMKQSGWKTCFVPSAKIFHIQGQTVGHNVVSRIMFYRSRYIYFKKWHKNSYPLIRFIIFVRLLINAILSLAGVVATLGMHVGIKKKLSVYSRLILWHFAGCPADR